MNQTSASIDGITYLWMFPGDNLGADGAVTAEHTLRSEGHKHVFTQNPTDEYPGYIVSVTANIAQPLVGELGELQRAAREKFPRSDLAMEVFSKGGEQEAMERALGFINRSLNAPTKLTYTVEVEISAERVRQYRMNGMPDRVIYDRFKDDVYNGLVSSAGRAAGGGGQIRVTRVKE